MTLDMDVKVVEELRRRAVARGVPVETYIEDMLDVAPRPEVPILHTSQERAAAFERWARNHDHGIVLPDEAMDRASFYEDRG